MPVRASIGSRTAVKPLFTPQQAAFVQKPGDEPSTGDSDDFPERGWPFLDETQGGDRDHTVEGFVGKRKGQRIRRYIPRRRVFPARKCQRRFIEVDACDPQGRASGKPPREPACTASHIKNSLAVPRAEQPHKQTILGFADPATPLAVIPRIIVGGVQGSTNRCQARTSALAARSMSSIDVGHPADSRTAPAARTASQPMAARTPLTATPAEWQAEPTEAATCSLAACSNARPLTPGKET